MLINIVVLNNDGNVYDCAFLGALGSWMTFKLPFIQIDNNDKSQKANKHDLSSLDPHNTKHKLIHLPLLHVPICVTSVILEGMILVDPNVILFMIY